MTGTDICKLARAVPPAVRDLGGEHDPVRLIEVTGRVVAGLELEGSRAQARCRLAGAVGSYLTWLRPPADYQLAQAAFGRMWWERGSSSVLDIVVMADEEFEEPAGDLGGEVGHLTSAGVVVRLVAPEYPAHTRTYTAGQRLTGWRWSA